MKTGVAIMLMAMLLSTPIMPSSGQSADGPFPQSADGPSVQSADGPFAQSAEGPPPQSAEGPSPACAFFPDPCDKRSLSDATLLQTCCNLLIAAKLDTECFCLALDITPEFFAHCSFSSIGLIDCDSDPHIGSSSTQGEKLRIIIGVSVAIVVLVVLLIIGFICIRRRRLNVKNYAPFEPNLANESQDGTNKASFVIPESLQYKLVDIETATNNFSIENKIGRGGFGIVYKGTLSNGQQIAVKRLSNGSGQGDKEFQTEIVLLAKLQHKNLVRLLGFCVVDDEALLVYELVKNKSLDYFLFDDEKRAELNWQCRFEIIKGVARGMLYLHEDSPIKTMHRDLKAANVLLDGEMCPKIADFGLARICDVGQTHINPTRVVGTHGYMAPEYLFHGQFSPKSDVYALGVLILEIVSGTRVGGSGFNQPGSEGLLSYAWRCWEDEKPLEVLDPMLRDSSPSDEVRNCVQLGLLCVQDDNNLRPTMSTIVHMFNSQPGSVTLSMPQHPAYIFSGSSYQTTTMSSVGNTTSSMV